MRSQTSDIIIVGAGAVGLSLACLLAQRSNLSITILESQHELPTWCQSEYDHRVSAIALASQRIFQAIDVWDTITKSRLSSFDQIEVWDALGKGKIHFAGDEIAEPVLGHIIENSLLRCILLEKIKTYAHIQLITDVKLRDLNNSEKAISFTTEDDHQYQSQLAIAADGANSWLRQASGIAVDKHDYQQSAIVATVETALAHQQKARQVFLATGPLAFLPLDQQHFSSIVWSCPKGLAKKILSYTDEEFKPVLEEAFPQLGQIISVTKRYSFPLYKQQSKAYVKAHVALVGDAAHTIHPLAGQGLNMGLLDAASLAQIILEAVKQRKDFASFTYLRRYERWRKADNLNLFCGVDLLNQLFTNSRPSLQYIRSFGLNMTNHTRFIKNIFMHHAVGNRDGLPEVAR